jgi:tetratricopeptide (TPR) repeat protein
MPDPSKPVDWLNRIPGWLKAMWASVAAFAAAIIAFQDNWRYYLIAAVIVIPVYLLAASVYVLFARRKTRSKKTPWEYRYGNRRFLGLIGLGLVCLFLVVPFVSPAAGQFGRELFLGTPIPTATLTPRFTDTPIPTRTLTPTPTPPRLGSPDVLIAPFDAPASSPHQVEQWLQDSLEQKLDEYDLDNVTVHAGETPIRSEVEAQAAANETGSKVVIWGWYDDLGIQVKIFLSGGDQAGTLLQGTKVIPLASSGEPESDLSVVITETLPQNVTFLSLYVVGHLEYLSNNYQTGHRAFDAAMAQIPAPEKVEIKNQAILHFFRARQMDRSGIDPQQVICEYVQAIELDPQFGVAYNNLGLVASKMHVEKTKLTPEAQACLERLGISNEYADLPTRLFERAVLADPNLTLARYNQFAFVWLQGSTRTTWIRSEMENIQRQDPGLIGTYIILGAIKDREGDPAGAIQMYQSGIAVEPNIPLLHTNLGQLYFSYEKDETRAEGEFVEALRLDPNSLEARLALGHLYYRQGRLTEATSHLDQIVLADTVGYLPLLVQRDAYILRSTISFTDGQQLTLAIDDIKLALTKPFGDVFLPFLLGLLYQQDGQNDLAAENFSESANRAGSATHDKFVWNLFKDRCFTEETTSMPFADWALTRLPSSTCLPVDPRERILAAYGLLNEQMFALREAPQMIILGAQCPFVYTEDPLTGTWEFDTTILYNIVDREAIQMRPLTRFNGRLLVREEEPEISYLNRIRVIAEMADGSFQTLEPDLEALKQADGEYIILHPGEEILVSLDAHPVSGEVSQWWVEAVGYYSPLR